MPLEAHSLKILHCIRSVNPVGGGPIEGLKQTAAINQLHGHEVQVASLDDPAEPWVKSCPLVCYALGPSLGKYGYSARLVPWLKENRSRFDMVVVNGIWQYNAFGTWRALHGTSTPYCVYTHGMLDPWFKRAYPLKHLKKWLYWPLGDYRVLRDAAAVLFTCVEEKRLASQSFALYRCNGVVANYGTAGPTGDASRQRELFLAQYPQLVGKRCLLFLGRVHVKKGPDLLMLALAQVLRRLPIELTNTLHLVMAGPDDSDYAKDMKRLARTLDLDGRITWTGMLVGDVKWGAFRSSEAFILPSHQENFGISVAESLACELPVLISDQVNIWREICNDQAGFVEKDDLIGTVNLMERWLQTPSEIWQKMRLNARLCFTNRFNVEQAANSLVSILRQAATDGTDLSS